MFHISQFAHVPSKPHSAGESLLKQTQPSSVADLFFSQQNVDILHEGIRYLVYKYSGCKHVISRQSDTELQIVMTGIYREYGKDNVTHVKRQVRDLNAMVLDFTVPRIMREINMHMVYKSEVMTNVTPIDRPVSVSSAGSKSVSLSRE
jgi:hypothetical protein